MRKSITKKIDEKEYTIKELTLEQIFQLLDSGAKIGTEKKEEGTGEGSLSDSVKSFVSSASKVIEMTAAGFGTEDLIKLTPSELMLLWSAFKEVNSDFLSILEKLGLMEILKEVGGSFKETLLTSFSGIVATLSKLDM